MKGVKVLWLSLLVSGILVPSTLEAQPGPAAWTRYLDLRCYQIPNQPALNLPLTLNHLDPVLVAMGLPPESVVLGAPNQLCVPVRKNAQAIPALVVSYLRWLDWKCYTIQGPPLNVPLHLDHLNPAISGPFGPVDVQVLDPIQLCVPVLKNNGAIPAAVLNFVRWVDVKCYRVAATPPVPNLPIQLRHLNPLFVDIPPENTVLQGPFPTKLCVPVAKNGSVPPATVFTQVAYSDVLCYRLGGLPLNWQLNLKHLNPVLVALGAPQENVFVTASQELCVPVAKNGDFPPP